MSDEDNDNKEIQKQLFDSYNQYLGYGIDFSSTFVEFLENKIGKKIEQFDGHPNTAETAAFLIGAVSTLMTAGMGAFIEEGMKGVASEWFSHAMEMTSKMIKAKYNVDLNIDIKRIED